MRRIRIGTRASALARWQTDHVIALWRGVEPALGVEVVDVSTLGDEMHDAPLDRMEGTGFFTSSLERLLLGGQIDLAIHSYKDLPVAITPGLTVAAVPARGPVEDALCARDGATLRGLPAGARVGTSSLRRIAQLRALRPDLDYRPLRGNVPTRLDRVARAELDAVVLARAGIERLGLGARATEIFPPEQVLTAPAQGALAIQVRADDRELVGRLAALDHPAVHAAVAAEREVLHQLRGGCSVPVGAFAIGAETGLRMAAGVFAPAGDRLLRVEVEGRDPVPLGAEAARRLLEQGAGEILVDLEREPRLAWERA
ncbi:MAG TPA: hydroxymethylbilane synthase [Candidatus Eisenbacteria bacterium]